MERVTSLLKILFFSLVAIALTACSGDSSNDTQSSNDADENLGVGGATLACDAPVERMLSTSGVEFVRTPDSCFESLVDFPQEARYLELDGLRQAYVEAGPADGKAVLLLHGQPSWSYLYRKMIPVLAEAGYRVIAMDHLGTGRSDKPTDLDEYTYLVHTDRLARFITELGLSDINLFVQDWGSLIGLKVAGENPDWFASIAVSDGALPNLPAGVEPVPAVENPNDVIDLPSPFADAPEQQVAVYDGCELLLDSSDGFDFGSWMEYAMKAESFRASEVLEALTWFPLSDAEEAAYDAPYPSREYMAGIRKFPSIINELGGQTQDALAGLSQYEKPFLTIWASNDSGNLGSCEAQQTLIDLVPGAVGQAHTRLPDSSHFLQDDQGEEIARRLVDFYENPAPFPSDPSETPSEPPQITDEKLGFEILEIKSANEVIVWASSEITQEEFDRLELPEGWAKNQVRQVDASGGSFSRSPDATEDGPLLTADLFGFRWQHNATIVETGIALDEEGLLEAASIEKFHTVSYDAGSTLYVLVAPSGDEYLRITRDAGRTSDTPSLPEGWSIREQVIDEPLELTLPNPTLNIRTDNQDSFQGPVSLTIGDGLGSIDDALNSGLLPLSDRLCEDPANMDALLESPVFSVFATSGDNNSEQIQRMVENPTAGPFYMFNFIRFRELAVYEDGRETDLTGREANDIYNPIEFLTAIGARPVFLSAVDRQIEGGEPLWEEIAVVEYPCPVAFFAMILNPGFQDRLIHKNAGVETTWVIVTDLLPSALPEDFQFPESPFPASDADPAFERIHLRDYFETAQYEAGSTEPERSGEAAWSLFVDARSEAKSAVGSVPSVRLQVQGVFSGDTQAWDAIDIDFFPSNAAFEALTADETRQQALFHRQAALAGSYSLITYPTLNIVPGVPEGSGTSSDSVGSLPVTELGVGQVCMSDADCVGIGTCLNSGIGAGFCTRQCGAGECGGPYTCCGSCAEAVATQLPFTGSACLPPDAAEQLSSAPASCSCQ
ncbi:MAG: haloalkane dehalogenase [Pseudomonadota bacterium]